MKNFVPTATNLPALELLWGAKANFKQNTRHIQLCNLCKKVFFMPPSSWEHFFCHVVANLSLKLYRDQSLYFAIDHPSYIRILRFLAINDDVLGCFFLRSNQGKKPLNMLAQQAAKKYHKLLSKKVWEIRFRMK